MTFTLVVTAPVPALKQSIYHSRNVQLQLHFLNSINMSFSSEPHLDSCSLLAL
ncbi:uncharacterized protein EI90DRAFT_3093601, partial [Cantharellus anzutake]|uniref:uncharacterized protein n=1 Tax=Cantharellus anzutake TaxID=1750568 RepID=UPI001907DE2B